MSQWMSTKLPLLRISNINGRKKKWSLESQTLRGTFAAYWFVNEIYTFFYTMLTDDWLPALLILLCNNRLAVHYIARVLLESITNYLILCILFCRITFLSTGSGCLASSPISIFQSIINIKTSQRFSSLCHFQHQKQNRGIMTASTWHIKFIWDVCFHFNM